MYIFFNEDYFKNEIAPSETSVFQSKYENEYVNILSKIYCIAPNITKKKKSINMKLKYTIVKKIPNIHYLLSNYI